MNLFTELSRCPFAIKCVEGVEGIDLSVRFDEVNARAFDGAEIEVEAIEELHDHDVEGVHFILVSPKFVGESADVFAQQMLLLQTEWFMLHSLSDCFCGLKLTLAHAKEISNFRDD